MASAPSQTPGVPGRPPHKQQEIARHLTGAIRAGQLQPGDRLPVRTDLMERFATTSTTVQRAIDGLVADGNLATRPRAGTFVAPSPPCLYRMGLLFPTPLDRHGDAGLFAALARTATAFRADDPTHFRLYGGLEGQGPAGQARRAELLDDIAFGRLGGLLSAASPHYLADTPIPQAPLPRVAVQSPGRRANWTTIGFGKEDLLDAAVDWLVSHGCRRLALIAAARVGRKTGTAFRRALAGHDLAAPSAWVQAAGLEQPHWASQAAALLLHSRTPAPPDGIIVSDDTLTPHVIAGIHESGRTIGQTVQVVSHCNFTAAEAPADGVIRIGYDMRELLRISLERMAAQRAGKRRLRHADLRLRFQWELAGYSPDAG